MDFIFGTVWGWIVTAGLVVVACIVVGYFFPGLRTIALAVAGVFISFATVYTKGARDARAAERRKTEAAIKKVNEDYDHIETRPDTPNTVADRLRRGSF